MYVKSLVFFELATSHTISTFMACRLKTIRDDILSSIVVPLLRSSVDLAAAEGGANEYALLWWILMVSLGCLGCLKLTHIHMSFLFDQKQLP